MTVALNIRLVKSTCSRLILVDVVVPVLVSVLVMTSYRNVDRCINRVLENPSVKYFDCDNIHHTFYYDTIRIADPILIEDDHEEYFAVSRPEIEPYMKCIKSMDDVFTCCEVYAYHTDRQLFYISGYKLIKLKKEGFYDRLVQNVTKLPPLKNTIKKFQKV